MFTCLRIDSYKLYSVPVISAKASNIAVSVHRPHVSMRGLIAREDPHRTAINWGGQWPFTARVIVETAPNKKMCRPMYIMLNSQRYMKAERYLRGREKAARQVHISAAGVHWTTHVQTQLDNSFLNQPEKTQIVPNSKLFWQWKNFPVISAFDSSCGEFHRLMNCYWYASCLVFRHFH